MKNYFDDSFIVYYFISLIVFVGAMINHLIRIENGEFENISLKVLFLDLLISIFIALIVFSICNGINLNDWVTAGLIGISVKRELGFFNMAEKFFIKIIEYKFKKD